MESNLELSRIADALKAHLDYLQFTHAHYGRYLGPLDWEYTEEEVQDMKKTVARLDEMLFA